MPRLKVFRTPIGFHDAYVAAPSRKAALAAWGADRDLFARGAAEEVTDPALTAAPLARPGTVIKVSRGDRDAQFAALPAETPKPPAAAKARGRTTPKPSRADLDAAERTLAEAEARHDRDRAALEKEQAELDRRKRDLKHDQSAEIARLERTRREADMTYRIALDRWRH